MCRSGRHKRFSEGGGRGSVSPGLPFVWALQHQVSFFFGVYVKQKKKLSYVVLSHLISGSFVYISPTQSGQHVPSLRVMLVQVSTGHCFL